MFLVYININIDILPSNIIIIAITIMLLHVIDLLLDLLL